MLVMIEPAGMLVPLTVCPAHSPAVELTVIVGLALTVVEFTKLAAWTPPVTPPVLLKVMRPLKVLLPVRVRTAPPLITTGALAWMVPATVWVTAALLIVSVPFGMETVDPPLALAVLRVRVP